MDGWKSGVELTTITWVSDDLYTALKSKFGREPTNEEMEYYMDSIDWNVLEERSIELGWEIMNDLIAMAEGEDNADK